jgi:hypothetical protein
VSRCALHVLAIGIALVLLLPVRLGAESCTGELRIDQRTFRRLDARHQVYAWVDDIPSKVFGGHQPFDLYLVAGKKYPPFLGETGKMTKPAFVRITERNYNTEVSSPLKVPETLSPKGQTFTVTLNAMPLTLVVTRVDTVAFGTDSVVVKLCQ